MIFPLIISVIFIPVFLVIYYFYIKFCFLIIQYGPDHTNQYESEFSVKYNLILFSLKILYSLKNNINIYFSTSEDKILFLNFFLLLILIFFSFHLLYEIYNNKIIFYLNRKFNLFKIFLINFNICSIFFNLLFFKVIQPVIIVIIFYSCLIALNIYIILHLDKKIKDSYLESNNSISKLLYFINEQYNLKDEDLYHLCDSLFASHISSSKCTCNKWNSSENLNHQNSREYYLKVSKTFIKCIRKSLIGYNKNNILNFKLISMVINFNENNKKFKVSLQLKKMLENSNITYTYYSQLELLSRYIRFYSVSETRRYNIFKLYESNLLKIKQSILQMNEFILFYEQHSYLDFYKTILILNDNRKQFTKKLDILHKNKSFYEDNYSFIILCYIFQNFL